LKDSSTTTGDKVEITYIEFEKKKTKTGTKGDGATKAPEDDMPPRDQTFGDSGDQGKSTKGEQKAPGRKKKDGSKTEGEDVTKEKQFKKNKEGDGNGEMKKRPEEGEMKSDTTATEGYGVPTKGTYNAADKGYKTFGTTGQGENKEGVKDKDSTVEADRIVQITVEALADQGSDTILLETGNYEFLEEYTFEAEDSATTLTVSAFVGLIAASMI